MKKIIFLILIIFLSADLYPQSKILFTIDSPLAGPVKPRYQMIDYSIPFKNIFIIKGAYSGIKLIFSENENNTEFYRFIIELPEINKLKFVSVNDMGRNKYVLENESLPLVLTNNDFSGVFSEKLQTYIYPKIKLEKFTKTDKEFWVPEEVEFKNFVLTISELIYESNLVSLKAIITGSVFFSSDIRYDVPYDLNATLEIQEEELSEKVTD